MSTETEQATGVRIVGTGSYVPDRVLTNAELEKIVDTTDEWIRTRTGIRERRLAADDEPTSAMAAQAALRALDAAGLSAADIDLIIVATITPDQVFPNTACHVQRRIGAANATCFAVEAACSGFTYILEIGSAMLRSGAFRTALVIGADKLSTIMDWDDRTTCVLFGDAAGAAVLKAVPAAQNAYLSSALGSDGSYAEILHVPGGGSAMPLSQKVLDEKLHYMVMSGQEVFKLAVTSMANAARQALARAGLTTDDLRWVIPHQANVRIISSVGKRLELPDEKVYINVDRYGNTSAASIPLALDELVRSGQVERGDHLLLVAFGGGLTWGANLLRW